MKTCLNCGAPLEPYKCKCEFCGTWYFDFTAFDMTENTPYYVKFRTPMGVITTLARPELKTIETWCDTVDITDSFGTKISSFRQNNNCDLSVVFHSQCNPETKELFRLEVINE